MSLTSTSMSLRPDDAFAMTMMRRWQAQPVRTTFLLRTTRSDDDAMTFAPRAGHALRTCSIKYGCYSLHPTEATQLHVVFLVQDQVQLLDCQAVIMLRRIRRKSRRKQRSCWVRSWLSSERRLFCGHYDRFMRELRVEDHLSSTS